MEINSHTGMRPDDFTPDPNNPPPQVNERSIRTSLVRKLANQGGVFGKGISDDNKGGDQLGRWIEDYYAIWNAMNFHGVALGTDYNGMSPTMPGQDIPSLANQDDLYNEFPQDLAPNKIDKCVIGNKSFAFQQDGLAHYGMLADFIEALRRYDDRGADIADYLLSRTAEDTIKMWEMVEQAAARIP